MQTDKLFCHWHPTSSLSDFWLKTTLHIQHWIYGFPSKLQPLINMRVSLCRTSTSLTQEEVRRVHTYLPFTELQVWYKVCLQQKCYNPSVVAPMLTIHACPPNHSSKHGWYDFVIMNTNEECVWPFSSLQDTYVCSIELMYQLPSKSFRTFGC